MSSPTSTPGQPTDEQVLGFAAGKCRYEAVHILTNENRQVVVSFIGDIVAVEEVADPHRVPS
jgi:hypothetical protein